MPSLLIALRVLLMGGFLGGCCEAEPINQIYIIAEKVFKKKEMASKEEIEPTPSKKSTSVDPKAP